MFKYLFIAILLASSLSYGECLDTEPSTEYTKKGQLVSSYTVDSSNLTAYYFNCILLNTILKKSSNFTNNFIINLTDINTTRGIILRVSNSEDLFMLIDFNNSGEGEYKFRAVTYPSPLKRLKEILQHKKFPKYSDLKLREQAKYKVVEGLATRAQIRRLINHD